MVECKSLASLCRALENHRNMTSSLPLADQLRHHNSSQYRLRRLPASPSSTAAPLCDQSTAAAFDVIMLLLVLGSMGFLFTPYFKYVCHEFSELLPATFLMIGEQFCMLRMCLERAGSECRNSLRVYRIRQHSSYAESDGVTVCLALVDRQSMRCDFNLFCAQEKWSTRLLWLTLQEHC